ncbi:lipocalin-like domain-containing protein [Nocardia huaxiensis]|uniref:Lipocalin-like domain-containing protein n=1 Tax=Nocardia huaxiensis TaxID=2755382 RepID=A0A7D6ZGR0_9NOCA|nr:lipocalin-like domain-containing protein [Nocardia huaxiensis]QLY30479.1 lipocalin-like domain-containing protein [Nocardia huaxiensis]UFS95922.1 lipocalin-like domain-containing protein [Nocardia huaxiensis]
MNAHRPAELVGTWKLLSLRQERADGSTAEPMGSDPLGYITYTESGYVQCILGPAQRPKLGAQPDEFAARDGLARVLFTVPKLPGLLRLGVSALQTVVYAGTWEVEGNTVIHHAELAGLPDWDGTDIVREYEVESQRLRLIARFPTNRVVVDWQRA